MRIKGGDTRLCTPPYLKEIKAEVTEKEELKKMKRNKIGAMFMVSVLALAGVGISYAGFTDAIHVYGTVDTATVDIDWIGWYSGTWVYKIYGFPVDVAIENPPGDPFVYDLDNEILIYRGFTDDQPTEAMVLTWASNNGGTAELEAYSEAKVGTTQLPGGTGTYDVDMVYSDIFPCIDFWADFIFHYDGSIPAKINVAEIFPVAGSTDPYPGDVDFLTWLWNYNDANSGYGAWVEAYRAFPIYDDADNIIGWNMGEPVDVGYQLHQCNYVLVRLVIHLPQDNNLQGLSGVFGGKIGVIQWNDQCQVAG